MGGFAPPTTPSPTKACVITTLTTLTCKITQKRDSPIKVMKKSKEKKLQDINKEERRLSELHRFILLATDQGKTPSFVVWMFFIASPIISRNFTFRN